MSSSVRAELQRIEHDLRSTERALLRLTLLPALRGGGDNALDAAPELQRQRSHDEDDLIKTLQRRIRERGARAPKAAYVKAALALARDHPPSFTPDEDWWRSFDVKDGCARTNVKDYKRRILRELAVDPLLFSPSPPLPHASLPPPPPALAPPPPPSLEDQADAVEAEIRQLEADRDAHLEAIEDVEASLRPLRRRRQYINHQRMMAAWRGVASNRGVAEPRSDATGPTRAASASSLSSEAEALHAEIDDLYDKLPEFVYERNEHERVVMGEASPKRVSWGGHVYNVPRPYSSDDADSGRHTM